MKVPRFTLTVPVQKHNYGLKKKQIQILGVLVLFLLFSIVLHNKHIIPVLNALCWVIMRIWTLSAFKLSLSCSLSFLFDVITDYVIHCCLSGQHFWAPWFFVMRNSIMFMIIWNYMQVICLTSEKAPAECWHFCFHEWGHLHTAVDKLSRKCITFYLLPASCTVITTWCLFAQQWYPTMEEENKQTLTGLTVRPQNQSWIHKHFLWLQHNPMESTEALLSSVIHGLWPPIDKNKPWIPLAFTTDTPVCERGNGQPVPPE